MRRTDILTPAAIRNAKPAKGRFVARLLDGDGLYLQITQSVEGYNKNWILRYELDGVRHDYGIGPLHRVSLAEARQAKHDLREAIRQGVDPLQEKREAKKQRLAEIAKQVKVTSFEACARLFYAKHRSNWKNPVHQKQWISDMERLAFPVIGRLSVADIDTSHVLKVLEPIWSKTPETASRLQGRMARVFDYAKAAKLISGDNPAARKPITALLGPKTKNGNGNGHHPALKFDDLPQFMAELRARDSLAARAMEFTILTAVRTGDTIGALWDEIDLTKKLWIIPAERMKADREHRVPLSNRAVEILKGLKRHGKHPFGLSNNAMLKLLGKMRPDVTVHGFRSTFRDWVSERTNYPDSLAEFCLAHKIANEVEAAYRRGDGLAKRVRLMQTWADYAKSTPRPAEVSDIAAERAKRAS
jgi:integrase